MLNQQYYTMVAVFGADISLYGLDKASMPNFEESRIRQEVEMANSGNQNKVKSYSINTANVKRQFMSPGEEEVYEFIIGGGLRVSKSMIKKVGT